MSKRRTQKLGSVSCSRSCLRQFCTRTTIKMVYFIIRCVIICPSAVVWKMHCFCITKLTTSSIRTVSPRLKGLVSSVECAPSTFEDIIRDRTDDRSFGIIFTEENSSWFYASEIGNRELGYSPLTYEKCVKKCHQKVDLVADIVEISSWFVSIHYSFFRKEHSLCLRALTGLVSIDFLIETCNRGGSKYAWTRCFTVEWRII